MGVRRCKHGQHEVFPTVKAGGSELSGSREEARPLPSRVRRGHCEDGSCDGETMSLQASKHIPRFRFSARIVSFPFPSVACRDVRRPGLTPSADPAALSRCGARPSRLSLAPLSLSRSLCVSGTFLSLWGTSSHYSSVSFSDWWM